MKKTIKLIALNGGVSKAGKKYYRATFKSKTPSGEPVIASFFLNEAVGDSCRAKGLLEDVDVVVEAGMDDFLRLAITNIIPADEVDESAENELF